MKKDYYWSLLIEPDWVQASIWKIDEHASKAVVLAVGPSTHWENNGDLVEIADTALSATIQKVDDEVEPENAVFGLSPSWVSGGDIKEEHLGKIKRLCEELSLKPHGFVVLPEALAFYFKSQEGSPLSAVVIGLSDESLDVSVFKLGSLVATITVSRSVSLSDDVLEGLSRFSQKEPFPSRFILYNGKEGELEDARATLTDANLMQNELGEVNFLHAPNIEILSAEQKSLAICLAGASETNSEVQGVVYTKKQEFVQGSVAEKKSEVSIFNLFSGKDENLIAPTEPVSAADVGFVLDDNHEPEEPAPQPAHRQIPVAVQDQPISKSGILGNIKLPKIKVPKLPNLEGSGLPKTFVFGIIVLVLVLGGLFAAWWFLPKATVTIYVSPQTLERSELVKVDPNAASVSVENGVLPGQEVTASVTGDRTKNTTGTKQVGERAKGTIEIRNGTADGIEFDAGTIIESSAELKFTLDKSASVSAASSPLSPGTVNVEVTAEEVGAEYNLTKDEGFSVSNYPKSEVDAVATVDFSGGSSREIQAVAEVDQKTLEDDLKAELTDQAKSELGGKASEGNIFIEDSIESEVAKSDFNHKVGDEADTLRLSMDLDTSALVVSEADINEFLKRSLENQVPPGFVVRGDQVKTEFAVETSDEGQTDVEVRFTVNLLPEIVTDDIAKNIAGKYPQVAHDYLATIPGFSRAELNMTPKLPGKLSTLPRLARNISVEIAAER